MSVLMKTGRAVETGDAVRKPADDFGEATSTVTTKKFVGGLVLAQMLNTGADEPFERGLLYSDCGVGTDPPAIAGQWKAVEVSSVVTDYANRSGTARDAVVSLLKVCAVLDSHPGVTKCIAKELQADTTYSVSVALYDGENLHTVVPSNMLAAGDGADETAILFAAGDLAEVENICNFFPEGGE